MDEPEAHFRSIEDHLFCSVGLDVWEKTLYYHLVRHTRLEGRRSAWFGIAPLAAATGMSDYKVRNGIRSLHRKGCVQIDERNRKGHLLTVVLPSEIPGLIPEPEDKTPVDLATLDVFSNRVYVQPLLAREDGRCFYCLREVDSGSCQLDHVVPQAQGVDNTYRNVVVACHECNTTKGENLGGDFVRSLCRIGLLSQEEVQNRLAALEQLEAGELAPDI